MNRTHDDTPAIETPPACSPAALGGEEWTDHVSGTETLFRQIDVIRELPDGYAFRIPADTGTLQTAVRFVAGEHRCCPFFRFQMSLDSGADHAWLSLGGGAGIRNYMAEQMIPLIRSARPDVAFRPSETEDISTRT